MARWRCDVVRSRLEGLQPSGRPLAGPRRGRRGRTRATGPRKMPRFARCRSSSRTTTAAAFHRDRADKGLPVHRHVLGHRTRRGDLVRASGGRRPVPDHGAPRTRRARKRPRPALQERLALRAQLIGPLLFTVRLAYVAALDPAGTGGVLRPATMRRDDGRLASHQRRSSRSTTAPACYGHRRPRRVAAQVGGWTIAAWTIGSDRASGRPSAGASSPAIDLNRSTASGRRK